MGTLNPFEQFKQDIIDRVGSYGTNEKLQTALKNFRQAQVDAKYGYNFYWLGVPVIQDPQDLQAWQELIWEVKPNVIIETGVAWGGSVIFNASMLTLLESTGQINDGRVIGIDIEIRPHNKQALAKHPLAKKITLIEGSSVDENIFNQAKSFIKEGDKVMVFLDSNHTHNHVLRELEYYSRLVSLGSYIIVADTGIDDISLEMSYENRDFGKGNNPKTAVKKFMENNENFQIDKLIESKILLTCSPDGFLKRIK